MSSSSRAVPYKGQRYSKIRNKCIHKKALFVDNEFPASGSSIYHSRPAPADIIWKRPKDIVSDPKFFIDKASADDFAQGSLGNCWFVAACACIAEDSGLWKKVVPDYKTQEWGGNNKYAGVFHFKFWRCGEWQDVVVDDYLPTRYGQLIFLHSKTRNEFWSALLEKAYAKLFGSYEALTAGKARDAMVDMTGGAGESLDVADFRTEDDKMRLFNILLKAMDHKSLMSSSIIARSAADMEAKLSIGLVKGHAYSVTAVKKIPLKGTGLFNFINREKILMIRLRNPWGGIEWRGPWSDGSNEWKKVSEKEKKDLGLTFDENGEFWMAFEDYCRYFTNIDICHMINTSMLSLKKTWREIFITNEWRRPQRAGGCGNNASFLKNPQYLFEVFEDEEEVMISMEQEDRRSARIRGDNHTIGVTIMKTDLNRKYRMHDKLDRVHAGPFVQSRSVFARVPLPKGRYCIIPSTFDPGLEGRFIMRFYSASAVTYKEMKRDEPKPPGCFGDAVQSATAVTVVHAENIARGNGDSKDLEAYCMILCENKDIRTTTSEKSTNPKWSDRATFYRKKPNEDVTVQVWETNLLKDSFIGSVTLPMSKAHEYTGGNTIRRYDLTKKGADDKDERTGFIWLKVHHTSNLAAV